VGRLPCAALLLLGLALPRVAAGQLALPRVTAGQSPEVGSAPAGSAVQRETARTWVLEGRRLFAAHDYAAALERYAAAYQLVRVPTVGIEVARAQEALGQWVEANATAVEVINLPRGEAEPEVFEQARGAARDLLRGLTSRIPSLQLDITPAAAEAQVEIDGEKMPVARGAMSFKLNPGTHQLRLSAPGYRPQLRTATLAEQEQQVLPVALVPEPLALELPTSAAPLGAGIEKGDASSAAEANGSGARMRGYVALGVAGTAAVLGGVAGVMAFRHKPECPGDVCFTERRAEADRSRSWGNVANVSFGVGLLAAAYGGWELLFNAAAERSISLAPRSTQAELVSLPGGALVQLSGAF
jgi:hypothetical protein